MDESKSKEHNCPSEETRHKTHSEDIQTYFHPILSVFESYYVAYRATVRFCVFDRMYLSQIESVQAHQQAKHRHHYIVGFSLSPSLCLFSLCVLLVFRLVSSFFACCKHTTNVYYVANEERDSCSEQTYASFLFISRPITFFLVFNRLIDASLTSNRLTVIIFSSSSSTSLSCISHFLTNMYRCIYIQWKKNEYPSYPFFSFFLLLFSPVSFSPH